MLTNQPPYHQWLLITMNNQPPIFQQLKTIMNKAQCRYSQFHVGCLLVTDRGNYEGFNIENAAYGNTICAERAALVHALVRGGQIIHEIHLISDDSTGRVNMCGTCRQSLSEHVTNQTQVYVYNHAGQVKKFSFWALLPESFGPHFLS